MKISTKTIYGTLIAFLLIFAACSSSDDNPEPPDSSGGAHTYDITVDGQRYSGEVDNVYGTNGENGAVTAVSTFQREGGETYIGFSLQNNDIRLSGVFEYPNGQDDNIAIGDDSDSFIGFMPPSGIGYDAQSGTAKVVVGEKITLSEGIPAFAALQIEFNGTFSYLDDDNDEQLVPASGSIKINLPPGY